MGTSVRYLIHKHYELHWNHLIPFALALALMSFFLLIAIPRRQSATEKGRHRVLPLSNQNNNHLISDFPADGAPLSGRISLQQCSRGVKEVSSPNCTTSMHSLRTGTTSEFPMLEPPLQSHTTRMCSSTVAIRYSLVQPRSPCPRSLVAEPPSCWELQRDLEVCA